MARLSFFAILGDLSALCMRLDVSRIWQSCSGWPDQSSL